MKFINEKKRGQCADSDSLGPQFSAISLAFYFCLQKILFCLRLVRVFFGLRRLTSILQFPDRRCSPPSARWISIFAFTLLFLCAGCSCKLPETTKEQENPVKRIQLNIELNPRSIPWKLFYSQQSLPNAFCPIENPRSIPSRKLICSQQILPNAFSF